MTCSWCLCVVDADLERGFLQDPGGRVDLRARSPEVGGLVSAESVALCLLRKFSEHQLPRASDLQWLVSEQQAPQSVGGRGETLDSGSQQELLIRVEMVCKEVL